MVFALRASTRFLGMLLVGCLLLCRTAAASVVVLHPNSDDANAIAAELVLKIPGATSQPLNQAAALSSATTVIALGPESLRAVPQQFKGRVVATFVSQAEFVAYRQANPHSAATALYTSPSPLSQLRLADELLHKPRVGLIYSKTTPPQVIEQYLAAAKAEELTVIPRQSEQGEVLKTVRRLISVDRMDVLLVLDDDSLYSSDVLIPTLRLLLRYNRSAIAFGPGVVKAGAIGATFYDRAAIFSSLVDLTKQVDGAAAGIPMPRYPDKASISVNRQYLRSVYDVLFVDESKIEEVINGH